MDATMVLLVLVLWTLGLALSAPAYRTILIFSGQRSIDSFPRSGHEGASWYKRAMDAHANALENLPLYIGVFVAALALDQLATLDKVAMLYLVARVVQSIVHIVGVNPTLVAARFTFWIVQVGCLTYVAAQLLVH